MPTDRSGTAFIVNYYNRVRERSTGLICGILKIVENEESFGVKRKPTDSLLRTTTVMRVTTTPFR